MSPTKPGSGRVSPGAGGFYWYDIRDDSGAATNPESHFGTVSLTNSPKPAYYAFQDAWRTSSEVWLPEGGSYYARGAPLG